MQKRIFIVILLFLISYTSYSQMRFEIDSVSVYDVDDDGKVIIGWHVIYDISDLDSIEIGLFDYMLSSVVNTVVDRVDTTTTSYLDMDVNGERSPSESSQVFRIIGYAIDETVIPGPWVNAHRTMHLSYEYFRCSSEILLKWTSYMKSNMGDTSHVEYYKIYSIVENDTNYIATVDPVFHQDIVEYTYELENVDQSIEFFVRAKGYGVTTSTSNRITLVEDFLFPPDTLIGNYATVTEDNYIELSFEIDLNADVNYYKLLKSESYEEDYDSVQFVYHDGLTNTIITFTDTVTYTDEKFYYQLYAVNECGIDIDSSNIIGNIILSAESNEDQTITISWMKSIPSSTDEYNLIRTRTRVNMDEIDDAEFELLDTNYIDNINVFPLDESDGKFCYQIKGINANNTNYEYFSNKACVIQIPKVFVPNAFTPDGKGLAVNNTFGPIISFASDYNYQFIIYNRWGEKVFETTEMPSGNPADPTGKWDGTNNGKPVKPGVYIYYIIYSNAENRPIPISGTVTIVYP